MSEEAHQLQEEFNQQKQEFQEIENSMPKVETKHGLKGDWSQGSVDDLNQLLEINEEQIRLVERIVELREGQMVDNPEGHDVGHSNAIAQWKQKLEALKGIKHLMWETRNIKLVYAETRRQPR